MATRSPSHIKVCLEIVPYRAARPKKMANEVLRLLMQLSVNTYTHFYACSGWALERLGHFLIESEGDIPRSIPGRCSQ